MNQEPIDNFKLPKNYNKDTLDNTTHLNKIKQDKEYFLPDIKNYKVTEYQIDNYKPISAGDDRNEVRLYKFSKHGQLLDWESQWGQDYNPYTQYHIQGHVHFSTVLVYTHNLSETVEQNLEYNLEKTSLSLQPISIGEEGNHVFDYIVHITYIHGRIPGLTFNLRK